MLEPATPTHPLAGVTRVVRVRRALIQHLNEVINMNKALCIISAACMAMFIGGCDSSKENYREQRVENRSDALEDRADQVRDAGESRADAIEKRDPGLMNSPATESAADALRDEAETRADSLEQRADQLRDQN
jgi:hypothetical protein